MREQGCSFGLRDNFLFWQNVSRVFLSKFLSFFSYEKPLFIGNSTVFNLKFSLNIYWELITNFEFKFKFDLNFGLAFNKNIPYDSFLLTLSYGFLHLMLPCGLISLADHPHHQLEINLITNIWSWTIGWLWIHHKILMSTMPYLHVLVLCLCILLWCFCSYYILCFVLWVGCRSWFSSQGLHPNIHAQ